MEDVGSTLVSEKESFLERSKNFRSGDGDAESYTSLKGSQSSRKKESYQTSCASSHGDSQSKITPQRLKDIATELGIVKLCWPPKSSLQERKYYPPTFSKNTNKEKLLMWYAENFRQQFHHEFPHRRPLLLAVENECGQQEIRNVTGKPKWAQQM